MAKRTATGTASLRASIRQCLEVHSVATAALFASQLVAESAADVLLAARAHRANGDSHAATAVLSAPDALRLCDGAAAEERANALAGAALDLGDAAGALAAVESVLGPPTDAKGGANVRHFKPSSCGAADSDSVVGNLADLRRWTLF